MMNEEKEYFPIDFSRNKRYASLEEHPQANHTPEEIKRRNAGCPVRMP